MSTRSNILTSRLIDGVIRGGQKYHRSSKTALAINVCVYLLVAGTLAGHANEIANRVTEIRVPGASKVFKAHNGADGRWPARR